jgi:hypothetical protein
MCMEIYAHSLLDSQIYVLHIFEMLFDCSISFQYMRLLKLTLGKLFFCKFFSNFSFQCETSGRTCSLVRMCAALPIDDLVVCRPDKWVKCSDASPLLSRPAAHHCIFFSWFIMSCCVRFLADFSRYFGILCVSLLIPLYSLCFPLFF